jgi:ABC-type transporter lipoprotein component MlaA
VADTYSTPRTYIHNTYWKYGLWLVDKVDARSRLLGADQLLDGAYDPYGFLRNAYLQHRDFKVNGGQSSSEEDQEQKMLEEAGQDEPQAPPSSTPPQTPPH